ncbi:MAG: hypothetical protein ABDH59_00070 [Fervidobacterium sp.]
MDVKNTYFVTSFFWKNYNAASKAKIDVEEIFRKIGLKELNLFKDTINSKFRRISFKKLIELLLINQKQYKNSNVIFQNGTGIDILIAPILKKTFKDGKRIIFVHDVESLRRRRQIDYLREKAIFPNFTHAICWTKEISEFLKVELGFSGKTYVYDICDYLTNDISHLENSTDNIFPVNSKFIIAFAGNLSKWKSGFLHYVLSELSPKNYVIHLYGKGFDGPLKDQIMEYKGAYPPEELPRKIKAHFGLVWDGESVENISGTTGEYLRYNFPHKASLYMVSGLPIIVWKQAAVYRIVKEYDIGFGINSLKEIDEVLSNLSENEYEKWKKNTVTLAYKISQGKNLENIIKQVIDD